VKRYQLTFALCSVFLAPVTALAQTPRPDTSLTANPVFQKNCAKCHGKTAQGHRFGGPSLISPKATGTPADKLHNIIANGKGHIPKFHMPKFRGNLTQQEIDVLVQQIRSPRKTP
jgi:mono/diheme cytochrome c family protein